MNDAALSTVFLSGRARQDIEQAVHWYDGQGTNLAQEFILELRRTLGSIVRYPNAYQRVDGDIRRAVMHRFRHMVAYETWNDRIYVLRVRPCRGDPDELRHV